MRTHNTPVAAFAAALVFAATGALAQKAIPKGDVKFMQEAAADGMAEVELAKVAQQKAMREEVQQFAKRMAEDHTKANEDLKAVAAKNGIDLPAAPPKKERKEMERLQKLSGGDFDREYMKHMLSDHKKDVKEFRKHAKSKTDNDTKEFAARTLPTLEDHLEMAKSTYQIAMAAKRADGRETGSTRK